MYRRTFLGTAAAGLLGLALSSTEVAAASEVHLDELIAMTKKTKPEDLAAAKKSAAEAAKLGWTCPTQGHQMHWIGKWNLTTHKKGERAQLTMLKGGKVKYESGAKPWFAEWHALSGSGNPMLMVLSDGKKEVYFQYYEWRKGAAVFLSNYSNRKQYMVLTARS
ncbi:hypothetical protein [Frigidibacter mobilis]|uniref:Secreted protein n=1 Tax=Frigidibacter mobilis TaxID=1335048 RepID=A0A165SSS6_9RHOB|nr:hypothetical protein [Frigidibacter mobilis]AMY70669.1 hypothetical protein AKL17_3444 [Frigidibacter mobilis]